MLHHMQRFQVAVFVCRSLLRCDSQRSENEVDHQINILRTSDAPEIGHEHRLLRQRLTVDAPEESRGTHICTACAAHDLRVPVGQGVATNR